MFVRLENGELFNLNSALKVALNIIPGTENSPYYCVEVQYIKSNEVFSERIFSGTKKQCETVLDAISAGLGVIAPVLLSERGEYSV